MADQRGGVPAPTPNQQQQQQQHIQNQAGQQQQVVHLNWSNFKPESLGKPDEDAEACLLCSNDWNNAHHFVEEFVVHYWEKHDYGTNHWNLSM